MTDHLDIIESGADQNLLVEALKLAVEGRNLVIDSLTRTISNLQNENRRLKEGK